ncbi:MAG: efflux RND transporter periplasmic adaptor subunit [Azonexus sp.]|nr:efflux RND transporter periplasmic adaptor subunit [Azonexus sp.]
MIAPPKKRQILIALALLVTLLVIIVIALPRLLGEKTVTYKVSRGELRQSVVASGKVRSPQRIELTSQISGRVMQIPVQEGQAVVAGELLIRLDDTEWRAALAQARAALSQSELRLVQIQQLAQPLAAQSQRQAGANLQQARQNFARTDELVGKGFYSKTQLDEAQRNFEIAESQWQASQLQLRSQQNGGSDERLARIAIEQARASVDVAQSRLDYTRLTTPVAGMVLTRSVEPGITVQPGKVLMTLSPAGDTELIAQIDEKNLALLRLGQEATASADAYPEQRFAAELTFISPAIDPLRGSVEIRLRVKQAPAYLRQEMTVSVDIETARRADTLSAPSDALRGLGSAQPWVLVARDGVVQRQQVKIGIRSAGMVEIVDGLVPGDLLVPANNTTLREGSRLRAVAG